MNYKLVSPEESKTFLGEYDGIKNFINENSNDEIAKYIYNLEKEVDRLSKGLETAKNMLDNRVTKDRYNNLVKKYNKLIGEKK